MNDDLFLGEDDLTPDERAEVEREYAEYRQFIDEQVEGGWIWNATENTPISTDADYEGPPRR